MPSPDPTRKLWCIDRDPAKVDYEWIKRNAFRLEDHLKQAHEESDSGSITIGKFTLKQSANPGKVWMTGASGEKAEIDETVLEDLLASVF